MAKKEQQKFKNSGENRTTRKKESDATIAKLVALSDRLQGVYTRTIDRIITKVNGQYGAPHGRHSIGTRPTDKHIYDCAVPMSTDAAYDKGGAYWGLGAQLRVSYTKDLSYIHFYRTDEIIYTTESGTEYTYKEALNIAKGNRKLLDLMLDVAEWRHLETVFEDLLMEGEIDETGNLLF